MNEDKLFNLSDEELEKEFYKAKEEIEQSSKENVEEIKDIPEDNIEIKQDENVEITNEEQPLTQETPVVTEEEKQPAQDSYKIKANGIEYEFTLDELQKLAPKAMDYTKKMQAIAPYKKTINALEENGITLDEVNLLIDIKKGSKEALASLVKNMNIDVYDLPDMEEKQYTPTQYGLSDEVKEVRDTINSLKNDSDFIKATEILKTFDDVSLNYIYGSSENLIGFYEDVKNGTFNKLLPQANKLGALDGYRKPMLDYYLIAGQDYYARQNEAMKAEDIAKKQQEQEEINRAKASASLPKSRTDKKTIINYLDEDDEEEYEKWYKSLQNR